MKLPHIKRKHIIILIVYVLVLGLVINANGQFWAKMLGGKYPFSSFLFDTVVLGLILILLHLFNYGVKHIVRRKFGSKPLFYRVVANIIHVFIIIIIAGSFLIATMQLHPQKIVCKGNPQDAGLKDYKDVTFYSDGLRLSGWFIPAENKNKPIVVVIHGLRANKENFLYPASIMHELGYNVFIFDLRAHGNSDGHLTTFGIKEAHDVKAAYDWIRKEYPSQPVYALAYSLGGAAVIKAAAEYGIFDKIVLDSTFSRLENVARATVFRRLKLESFAPFVWQLERFWGWIWTGVDLDGNRPEKYMPQLTNRPLLIIHGNKDTIIPYTESLHLHEAANHHAQLWIVEDMQHIQSMNQLEYKTCLRDFFEK